MNASVLVAEKDYELRLIVRTTSSRLVVQFSGACSHPGTSSGLTATRTHSCSSLVAALRAKRTSSVTRPISAIAQTPKSRTRKLDHPVHRREHALSVDHRLPSQVPPASARRIVSCLDSRPRASSGDEGSLIFPCSPPPSEDQHPRSRSRRHFQDSTELPHPTGSRRIVVQTATLHPEFLSPQAASLGFRSVR